MGIQGDKWVDTPQNAYWRKQWIDAWTKMPRHSAKLLLELIGSYKIYGPEHFVEMTAPDGTTRQEKRRYCLANGTCYSNMRRGSKPKDPGAAFYLQCIANGTDDTMARAIAIRRNIEFK